MPVNYTLVPEHSYPSQLVVINDNTEVTPVYSTTAGGTTALFVFASPKGHDNKLMTITDGLSGFMAEYGMGPFSAYGQPLLNAYACASSGAATLHCMRVMPNDAAYAVSNLVVKYKVDDATKEMTVKFATKPATAPLTDLANLAENYTAAEAADADGFTELVLFSMAYQGRGVCGNNYRWRIASDGNADKENSYKNYIFYIYENDGGLALKETYKGNFVEDATYNGSSIFLDAKIAAPSGGSKIAEFISYPDAFKALFDAYKTANPDTVLTLETFDPLMGVNKFSKAAIEKFTISAEGVAYDDADTLTILPNTLLAVGLAGGADGAFDLNTDAATRKAAIEAAYLKAFGGELDPYIKSKRKFPTNIIFDAGYSVDVKKVIAQLATTRTDCVAIIDFGTGISTKQAPLDYLPQVDTALNSRIHFAEAYAGKVLDPYSQKNVTVTSTYWLAGALPAWFSTHNGKHRPMAGVNFGEVSGFVEGSLYPVYDEDIDSELMDQMVDAHINFLKVNTAGDIVRAVQESCQDRKTVMSEMNNVFVLLDIKRDVEKLCEAVEYQFAENATAFNTGMDNIAAKYRDAQVASIGGNFSQTEEEAEMQAIHLNVEFVTKNIVKHALIEIDINR